MVDFTELQSVPTALQLFDFAKGFAGQIPPDARVALVVRPEQVRHANVIEKVARKEGVFLAYFVDPGRAALWMQRSQNLRRKFAPEPRFQKSPVCEPSTIISTKAPHPQLREPHDHCDLCIRREIASSDIPCGTRLAAVAETQIRTTEETNRYERNSN